MLVAANVQPAAEMRSYRGLDTFLSFSNFCLQLILTQVTSLEDIYLHNTWKHTLRWKITGVLEDIVFYELAVLCCSFVFVSCSWISPSGCQTVRPPCRVLLHRSKARWRRTTSCPICRMWTRPVASWWCWLCCRSPAPTLWGSTHTVLSAQQEKHQTHLILMRTHLIKHFRFNRRPCLDVIWIILHIMFPSYPPLSHRLLPYLKS